MGYKIRQGALATLDAVENGAAVRIDDLDEAYVTISGTFVGTWVVQVSFDDGTTWAQFATGTTPTLTAKLPPAKHVRAICTAFTSGVMVCNISGRNNTIIA